MSTFIIYILKSSLTLAIFYLFYMALMSRDTFHRLNRIVLLSAIALSCVVPLIEARLFTAVPMQATIESELLYGGVVADGASAAVTPNYAPLYLALILLYFAGVLFFIGRNLYSIYRILKLVKSGAVIRRQGKNRLVLHHKPVVPFSWMHYVVMSQEDWDEEGEIILTHEEAHIALGHSWDMLLVELCVCLQWFNPAAWLMRSALQTIHEYEADEAVLRHGVNAREYQLLIIKKAVGARLYSIANSLNHSNIKKRITMMLKKKSSSWARLKQIYLLPAGALAVIAFASPQAIASTDYVEGKVNEVSKIWETESVKNEPQANVMIETPLVANSADVSQNEPADLSLAAPARSEAADTATLSQQEPVFEVCEKMPQYPGGQEALFRFLSMNIKYPVEAAKAGATGRSIVTFIITSKGEVTNPRLIRSAGNDLLDKEALRVVSSMPNWSPGIQKGKAVNVKFTIPISFRLNNDKGGNGTTKNESSAVTVTTYNDAQDEVFQVCEQMPLYPGGSDELMKYLTQNVQYPKEALEKGITGRSIISFIVNKDGSLGDVKVAKSAGNDLLDAEAIRVVKAMPKWTPGKQRGQVVRTQFTLPVVFSLK